MLIPRRSFLGAGLGGALAGCSSTTGRDDAALGERRAFDAGIGAPALMNELVRYATLAPSSHNTQCWKFRLGARQIAIEADLSRRCPVVDPDEHHLFVSLGCATENLAQAALANGLQAEARFDPAGEGAVALSLAPTRALASPLYQAIPLRQCTRGDYDGSRLAVDELRLLARAGNGDSVRILVLTDRVAIDKVLEFVVAGNTAQMNDPAFVAELKQWIRFSAAESQRTGDGLYAGASGVMTSPRWLGSRLMSLFVTAHSENDRYAKQVRNSSGIAIFISERSDKAHWVEAGRCYERFALQAAVLGIRTAFLNQPVEVAAVRAQFAAWLGLGPLQRPDLVVRFGRGPGLPWSMRRPVQAVMV